MADGTTARATAQRRADAAFRWITAACGALMLALVAGVLVQLAVQSAPALRRFGPGFLYAVAWDPVRGEFGAAASLYGTLLSTLIAMLLAAPLGLVIALFLVELAHPTLSRVVGSAIELLAAIPSIIYGMWGLFVFAPFLARHIQPPLARTLGFLPFFQGPPMGIGFLSAGLILALMVLPFTSSVMRDVFRMVPAVVKEAGYGMGATTWEVTRKVTIRYGIAGITGAIFLGLGRAVGETMAVTFVIGNAHRISPSLFAPGTSIASTLANEFTEAADPLYVSALIALGLVLFLVTFVIQVVTHLWLGRLRRRAGGGL